MESDRETKRQIPDFFEYAHSGERIRTARSEGVQLLSLYDWLDLRDPSAWSQLIGDGSGGHGDTTMTSIQLAVRMRPLGRGVQVRRIRRPRDIYWDADTAERVAYARRGGSMLDAF